MRLAAALIMCGVLAAGSAASAAPTALNVIPIAKVLPRGQSNLDLQFSSVDLPKGSERADFYQTEFGVSNVVELGVDKFMGAGGGWFWNAKWLAYDESERRPALAFGIQNIVQGGTSQPYAVALKHAGTVGLHLGWISIGGNSRVMAGIDGPLGKSLVVQADYISGSVNLASLGIVVNFGTEFSLNVAALRSNIASGVVDGYLIIAGWTGGF